MPLSDPERRILLAIGGALYPSGGAIALDAEEAGVVEYIEDYLDRLPRMQRWQLRLLFRAFDLGHAVTALPPGRRFVAASLEEQQLYLASWEHDSRYWRRIGFSIFRMVFALAYAEHPAVKEAIGTVPREADLRDEIDKLPKVAWNSK